MQIPKDWPETGYVRFSQIVPDIVPVSESTWFRGVRSGRFPRPVKGGPNTSLYSVAALRDAFERIERGEEPKAA